MYTPGHLGELTQNVNFVLVDAVIEETESREKRLRLLPSRVVVYAVLALALSEDCSYRAVWLCPVRRGPCRPDRWSPAAAHCCDSPQQHRS